MPPADDFLPTATWRGLERRAALLRTLRAFFDGRGFLEVDTPVLSADTVVDRHLDPIAVDVDGPGGRRRAFLQTSPEFAMKRLLAAGSGPIYQVAHAFRHDELGPLHNIEFTLAEWYQPGAGLQQGMDLLAELCRALLDRPQTGTIAYGEAFREYAGVDPHRASAAALAAHCAALRLSPPASLGDDRDAWLDYLLVERVQPKLGRERPTIVYDFPASQAALARVRPGEPPLAERFELYVDGIELANGYHELIDPKELRRRNTEANAYRRIAGKPPLPQESRLLRAMERGLPAATGCALGFDRVVMIAAGAKTLAEVIAFPFDRA